MPGWSSLGEFAYKITTLIRDRVSDQRPGLWKGLISPVLAQPWEALPADPYFATYKLEQAPVCKELAIKPGDKLAICGDSITEQKMYSRLLETYLTACVPELKVTARQYGWSGETAEGFLGRMKSDCLRFQPTVATTCYGMNDYKYRPYDEANGRWYREKYTAVARAFKEAGARVVLGSPGCVGKVASWVVSQMPVARLQVWPDGHSADVLQGRAPPASSPSSPAVSEQDRAAYRR
jgi:hypothetical protein